MRGWTAGKRQLHQRSALPVFADNIWALLRLYPSQDTHSAKVPELGGSKQGCSSASEKLSTYETVLEEKTEIKGLW